MMDRKKELQQKYKETKIQAGVFQIKNTKNQKIFIGSTLNLKSLNGTQFSLNIGSYINAKLQQDWNQYGEESFTFEVLELLEKKKDLYFDAKDALKKLEDKWLDQLQPYGERGYNKPKPA